MTRTEASVALRGDRVVIGITGSEARSLAFDLGGFAPFSKDANAKEHLDLLELFLAIYALDRIVRRPANSWSRHFLVTFPVLRSRLPRWFAAKALLEKLISDAMGDEVTLRPEPVGSVDNTARRVAAFTFDAKIPPFVSLFSEGLDSFAGVAAMPMGRLHPHALVSIVTNGSRKARIRRLLNGVRRVVPAAELWHYTLDAHLEAQPLSSKYEKTQRSRSMLAIAAGLTVTGWLRSERLLIHENGFGVLNLPFLPIQLLHESSQALHPANIRLWEQVAEILIRGIRIELPNQFRTKSEMVLRIPGRLVPLIAETSSCDGVPRVRGLLDCGRCGSCLYRRIAIAAAGYEDKTRYAPVSVEREVDALAALRCQAKQWREDLHGYQELADRWAALCRRQPSLRGSLLAAHDGVTADDRHWRMAETVRLLARHCDEMLSERIDAYAA